MKSEEPTTRKICPSVPILSAELQVSDGCGDSGLINHSSLIFHRIGCWLDEACSAIVWRCRPLCIRGSGLVSPASFTRTCWNIGLVLGRYLRKWFKHVLTVSQLHRRSFDCHNIKNRKLESVGNWNVHYSLPYMFYFTFVLPDLS